MISLIDLEAAQFEGPSAIFNLFSLYAKEINVLVILKVSNKFKAVFGGVVQHPDIDHWSLYHKTGMKYSVVL